MNSQIKEALKDIYVKALRLHVAKSEVPDDGLIERFEIDSIRAMELAITIESRFDIQIEPEQLAKKILDSLDVLAAYVRQRQEMPLLAGANNAA